MQNEHSFVILHCVCYLCLQKEFEGRSSSRGSRLEYWTADNLWVQLQPSSLERFGKATFLNLWTGAAPACFGRLVLCLTSVKFMCIMELLFFPDDPGLNVLERARLAAEAKWRQTWSVQRNPCHWNIRIYRNIFHAQQHSSIAPTCLCCSAPVAFYLKRKHQSGSMRWRVLEVYAECSCRILVCFRTLSSVLDHFFTISALLTSWLQDWGNWDEFGWSTDPAASSGSDEVQELQFLKTS